MTKRRWGSVPWLLAVLALAALARSTAPYLPHMRGDEPVYLALAAELQQNGLSSYSLRHQDLIVQPLSSEAADGLALISVRRGEERRGALIRYYASGGEDYHDREVSTYGPLFPAAVAASWNLCGPEAFVVVGLRPDLITAARERGNYNEVSRRLYTKAVEAVYPEAQGAARLQLFAVLPALLASLLTIAATFFFARQAGAPPPLAALAALLVATAPVELLAAQLVQSDTLAAGLSALGLLAGLIALNTTDRRACVFSALSGVALGLAVLAKPQAAVVGVAYGLTELLLGWRRGTLRQRLLPLVCFSVPALAISLPWILWIGTASVPEVGRDAVERGAFGTWVRNRPWLIYPLNLLVAAPQLLLGVVLVAPRGATTSRRSTAVTFCTVAVVLMVLATWWYPGRECRYLLPVYPALALLAALGCQRLVTLGSSRFHPLALRLVLALPLAALLVRSLGIGAEAARTGLTHWSAFGY